MLTRLCKHFAPVVLTDGLPEGWTARVRWVGVCWLASGVHVAAHWTVCGPVRTKQAAIEQVRYWAEDAEVDRIAEVTR